MGFSSLFFERDAEPLETLNPTLGFGVPYFNTFFLYGTIVK